MHRHDPLAIFSAHCLHATLQQGARERIVADTGPLEQGPGGCRPRSTSVPVGKDARAGAPAWNFEVAPDGVRGLLVCVCEGCASDVGETVPSVGAGTRLRLRAMCSGSNIGRRSPLGTGNPKGLSASGIFHSTSNYTTWYLLLDLQKHKMLPAFPIYSCWGGSCPVFRRCRGHACP